MSTDDFNDSEDEKFDNEDERKEFEKFYAAYLRGKETMKFMDEYSTWLQRELKKHDYAIIPYKYTGIKNLPLCLIKAAKTSNTLFVYILN